MKRIYPILCRVWHLWTSQPGDKFDVCRRCGDTWPHQGHERRPRRAS